jgi:hypothetical protein
MIFAKLNVLNIAFKTILEPYPNDPELLRGGGESWLHS